MSRLLYTGDASNSEEFTLQPNPSDKSEVDTCNCHLGILGTRRKNKNKKRTKIKKKKAHEKLQKVMNFHLKIQAWDRV